MLVLNGKEVSKSVRSKIALEAAEFQKTIGRPVGLGVLIVGEDPASHIYVRNKENACKEVGFYSEKIQLPDNVTEAEVLAAVNGLNSNKKIDGFLVQMPLPKSLNTEKILHLIDPKKDADGLHPENMGLLWVGKPRVAPCTPWGVMRILKHYNIPLKGKKAVVVGRSQIVGKPMAHLLLEADATVSLCHSKTVNLTEFTSQADVVVVAAGKPEFLGKNDFKKDSVVVDVGIHGSGQGKKICGDIRFAELENWVSAATPVPGGVGPMTITCLLENTLKLAQLSHSLKVFGA